MKPEMLCIQYSFKISINPSFWSFFISLIKIHLHNIGIFRHFDNFQYISVWLIHKFNNLLISSAQGKKIITKKRLSRIWPLKILTAVLYLWISCTTLSFLYSWPQTRPQARSISNFFSLTYTEGDKLKNNNFLSPDETGTFILHNNWILSHFVWLSFFRSVIIFRMFWVLNMNSIRFCWSFHINPMVSCHLLFDIITP